MLKEFQFLFLGFPCCCGVLDRYFEFFDTRLRYEKVCHRDFGIDLRKVPLRVEAAEWVRVAGIVKIPYDEHEGIHRSHVTEDALIFPTVKFGAYPNARDVNDVYGGMDLSRHSEYLLKVVEPFIRDVHLAEVHSVGILGKKPNGLI